MTGKQFRDLARQAITEFGVAVAMAVPGRGGHFSINFMRGFARVPAWLLAGDVRRPTAG